MKMLFLLLIISSFFLSKAKAQEDVKITNEQTITVFNLLFGAGQASDLSISDADKSKAVFFLQELIKGSCEMSAAQGLYSFDGSLKGVVESVTTAISHCSDATKNGKYYEAVRVTLARNFRSEFSIRKATGEW